MALKILLAATLRKYVPGYDGATGVEMEIDAGETAGGVAGKLGIPRDEVKLIMIDGIGSKWETVLKGSEERLAFFPPVGGG